MSIVKKSLILGKFFSVNHILLDDIADHFHVWTLVREDSDYFDCFQWGVDEGIKAQSEGNILLYFSQDTYITYIVSVKSEVEFINQVMEYINNKYWDGSDSGIGAHESKYGNLLDSFYSILGSFGLNCAPTGQPVGQQVYTVGSTDFSDELCVWFKFTENSLWMTVLDLNDSNNKLTIIKPFKITSVDQLESVANIIAIYFSAKLG